MANPTFEILCDAAVQAGEMHLGTTKYYLSLFVASAEWQELKDLRDARDNQAAQIRALVLERDFFREDRNYLAGQLGIARAAIPANPGLPKA